ncbi:MAG: acyltransferase family protein [Aureispira sp.]
MSTISNKTSRLHALDALRAVMMLLGLVIHTVSTYTVDDYGNAALLKDVANAHWIYDIINNWIHLFRMPIFFIIAGFFGALLYYERSPESMLKNRFKRIVVPFIVFLLVLWPFVAASVFAALIAFDIPFPDTGGDGSAEIGLRALLPMNTFHLWFLYYLSIMSFVAFGIAKLFDFFPNVTRVFSKFWRPVINNIILRMSIPILVLLGVLWLLQETWGQASVDLIPALNSVAFYSLFYLFGWLLFHHKDLLPKLQQGALTLTVIGTLLYFIYYYLSHQSNFVLNIEYSALLNALASWALSMGITGLFLKHRQTYSSRWRYISDASYWVYLIHLPIVILLPALLTSVPLPTFIKVLFTIGVASVICFWTYKRWVRGTAIGEFLNGQRYID